MGNLQQSVRVAQAFIVILGREAAMAKCETCGNDYDKAFQVTLNGSSHTFDSFVLSRPLHRLARIVAHTSSVMELKKTTRSFAVLTAPRRKVLPNCAIVLEARSTDVRFTPDRHLQCTRGPLRANEQNPAQAGIMAAKKTKPQMAIVIPKTSCAVCAVFRFHMTPSQIEDHVFRCKLAREFPL